MQHGHQTFADSYSIYSGDLADGVKSRNKAVEVKEI